MPVEVSVSNTTNNVVLFGFGAALFALAVALFVSGVVAYRRNGAPTTAMVAIAGAMAIIATMTSAWRTSSRHRQVCQSCSYRSRSTDSSLVWRSTPSRALQRSEPWPFLPGPQAD